MLKLTRWLPIALLFFPVRGFSVPYDRLVPIDRVGPTQMEIGNAHVGFSIEKIRQKAEDLRKADPSLSDVEALLRATESRSLPAIIDDSGRVRISDGHHWASAVNMLASQYPELAGRFKITAHIVADFRGKSPEKCVRYMFEHNIGYFTRAVREKFRSEATTRNGRIDYPDKALVQMYRYLPVRLSDLKNNPGRSAFGLALEGMGIVPENMLEDYIEFYMAEEFSDDLIKAGIDLSRFSDYRTVEPQLIREVQSVILTSPRMVEYLLSHLRPGTNPGDPYREILSALSQFRTACEGLDDLGKTRHR